MRPTTYDDYSGRITRVLLHIREHLDETLSLEELARVAHFSPYHFHRIFRGMMGESLGEHVRRLRLERAARRLRSSDDAITQVAFEAGYESHEAFTRAFRGMFSLSPSVYRSTSRGRYDVDGADDVPKVLEAESGDPGGRVRIMVTLPMPLLFVRHIGSFGSVGAAWSRLFQEAGARGLLHGRPTMIGIIHDDPEITPPDALRYDACIRLDHEIEVVGEFGVTCLPGGEEAVLLHRGPYERLMESYAWLYGVWLPHSGREADDRPPYEIYISAPDEAAPEDLLTEIHLPLRADP